MVRSTDSRELVAANIFMDWSSKMQRWTKLNDRQLDVLRRIDTGTDPVTRRDHDLAHTVYALRRRGLVTTPIEDGTWRAEITEAGRHYLEHGRFPETTETPPSSVKQPIVTAAALVRQLREEGTVRVLQPDERTRAAYRKAIHAIKQGALVPEGFELLHTGRSSGDLIIRLSDGSPEAQTEWNRIRLGARDLVSDPAGLAGMLATNPEILQVSEGERQRALRIVQSLAGEAEQRGHRLALSRKRKPRGLFLQLNGGHRFDVALSEEHEEMELVPDVPGKQQRRLYSWQRVEPEVISKPTGRLRLTLTVHHGKDVTWTDNNKSRLEARLLDIIKKAEEAAKDAEHRKQQAEREHAEFLAELDREKAETEARWRAAMAQATEQVTEEHRLRVLTVLREGWNSAREIRELCDALDTANSGHPNHVEAAQIRSWLDWARALADRLDPVKNLPRLADSQFEFEPQPDDLRPYLGDWSPEGPYQEYRRPHSGTQQSVSDLYREGWRYGRPGRAQWWRR
ncbi:cell envelope integrity protein TolA [Actinomadura sp. NAK00032]|uniref:cell envelope integrity protein TolA n=1 Tax=Actinomadura sp. NAK00032 TaxID=2742128 RepID=UPI00159141CB|nr:cell envelope integrity protein TolA [Actinomadura sp. NAK00032]QKW37058.1 cell envelope integrity protein TolA [Actinomadura sp. NAK00032]